MDDILFGNNNQATINRLAKRSYRANKQRNVFVTIALFLTAFMITSVFSLGCSYFETYQMQQIRAMGTTADVAITSLSEEQYEELSRSSLVSVVGVSQRLGSIDTSGMDDALLSITWIDETEWQEHRVPTISDIHGDYPQAKNEIMLPTWALRAMGIDDPQIGMNISLSYQLGTDYQYISDEFVLSGYYTDYSASRAGNRGAAYVSELFATQTGLPFDSVSTAMISFSDDSNALRSCEKLKRKISFTESQSFEIVPIAQSNSTTIVLPLAAIIVFIIISGYLLIYNILYISISRDTQFYGQLKTIGTNKKTNQADCAFSNIQNGGDRYSQRPNCRWYCFAWTCSVCHEYDVLKRYRPWGDSVLFPHYFCGCRNLHIFYCNHRQHETSENSCKYFSCCGFTLYGGKYKELPRS